MYQKGSGEFITGIAKAPSNSYLPKPIYIQVQEDSPNYHGYIGSPDTHTISGPATATPGKSCSFTPFAFTSTAHTCP